VLRYKSAGLQPIQFTPQDAKLRTQVAHERLVAEGVVRLPHAHDHPFHLVEKALDDGFTIFLVRVEARWIASSPGSRSAFPA
jgi:hypothetical protein